MKTYTFWLVRLLVIVSIFAVGSVPMVYADAHEAGEEMEKLEAELAEESSTSGWFRTDTDSLGTQIWVGASHSPDFLGGLSLDTDIYVVGTFGELDIGLGIPVVDSDSLSLSFLPMVGIGFDAAGEDEDGNAITVANGPSSLIAPQLFTYLTAGSIYFESWIQVFLNSMFDYDDDSLYTRNFVLYSLNDTIAIGPQVEVTFDLTGSEISSIAPGLRANVGYGENNTLGVFVGFEIVEQKDDEDRVIDQTGITSRMTFVRTW